MILTVDYPLTKEEFKFWLQSKNEDELVGMKKNGTYCPIATILKETNRQVYVDDIYTEINYKKTMNPLWVTAFTRSVDFEWEVSREITAKKALEILDNLYICTVCNKYNPEGKNCGKENCDW